MPHTRTKGPRTRDQPRKNDTKQKTKVYNLSGHETYDSNLMMAKHLNTMLNTKK